ncbi:MAG: hypothetical protein ABI239_13170, partial [Aquihabitans sp.]
KPEEQVQNKKLEQELAQQEPPPDEYLEPPEDAAALAQQKNKQREPDAPNAAAAGFQIPRALVLGALYGGGPLVLVLSICGAIVGYKTLRRKRRRTRGTVVQRASAAWTEVVDRLRDQGLNVPRGMTRREFAAASTDIGWSTGLPFASRVDLAMFGPDDPDDGVVEELWASGLTELKAAREPLTRRQRFRAAVSLTSLRGQK